jgi:uncharacterized membrane protein YphA (DoxX/SURF4 family)
MTAAVPALAGAAPANGRRDSVTESRQNHPVSRAIAVLRIFFGLVYLTNGLAKLVPGIAHLPGGYFLIDSNGARRIIEHNARHHPVQAYHDLVFNLLVPNWSVVGPLVGLAETAAGVLLILGLASSLGALLAALLSLHVQLSDATGPWLYEYAVEWVPLLCLAFMRAGAVWGLDGAIARTRRGSTPHHDPRPQGSR